MTKPTISFRNACRLCGSSNLRQILHFDNIPFADEFVTQDTIGTEFAAESNIYLCDDCKGVQTQHDVDTSDYYDSYQYIASASEFMRNFMQKLTDVTFERFHIQPGDVVIDIGSADGYQLECFRDRGAKVLGYEPASTLVQMSNNRGIDVRQVLFDAQTVQEIPDDFKQTQVVLLTHTFDHLPDPLAFLNAVKQVLDPMRGVLLIEVHNLADIVKQHEACLFLHEHTVTLHPLSMNRLLEKSGFKLLSIDLIPAAERRGTSFIVAAALKESELMADESFNPASFSFLDEWTTYETFAQDIYDSFSKLRSYIKDKVAAGKRVAGYGALGRGVMTSAMAKLNRQDLLYLYDRNPNIQGLLTPVSHIPVASPDQLIDDNIDLVIVFAHSYMDEIRQQLESYIKQGGQLISVLDIYKH